jgi:hypothetical protein
MATTVSSSTSTTPTAAPAPLPLGASAPSSPAAVSQATTLITVVQTRAAPPCSRRTVAATSGSGSAGADLCEFTGASVLPGVQDVPLANQVPPHNKFPGSA